jgi:hypothetical protein
VIVSDEFGSANDSVSDRCAQYQSVNDTFDVHFRCWKSISQSYIHETEFKKIIETSFGNLFFEPQGLYDTISGSLSSMMPGYSSFAELTESLNSFGDVVSEVKSLVAFLKENASKFTILVAAGFSIYALIRALCSGDYEPLQRVAAFLPLCCMFVSDSIRQSFDFIFDFINNNQSESPNDIPWSSIVTLFVGVI